MTETDNQVNIGIIRFPGTNCEMETQRVLTDVLGQKAEIIWHTMTDIERYDGMILPGGFSYGDHLRTGAIARFSPVMQSVTKFAEQGKPVLGICNGFQELCEAGLLPGAFLKNNSLKFRSIWVNIRAENDSILTNACQPNQVLRMPIAHGEGNFYAAPDVLQKMRENGQIILTYSDSKGNVTTEVNPNGSVDNIAGITNEAGNVAALMPHPERASEAVLGGEDGRYLLQSFINAAIKSRH